MNKFIYILCCLPPFFASCIDNTPCDVELPANTPAEITLTSESPYVTVYPGGTSASVDFRSFDGKAVIEVITEDSNWKIETGDGGWLTAERDGKYLVFSVGRNTDVSGHKMTVKVVTGEGTGLNSAVIDVSQRGFGTTDIAVDKDKIIMTAGGQFPQTINVQTDNDQWSVKTASNWLLVEQEKAGLKLTADPNPDTVERETIIDLIAQSADRTVADTVSVFIVQEAKSYLKFNVSYFSYSEMGGEGEFEVETNQRSWDLAIEDDWIEAVKDGDTRVKFKVAPSSEIDNRSGLVTITTGDYDNVTVSGVPVSQLGTDPSMMIFMYKPVNNSLTVCLPLYGEVECTVDWGDGSGPETVSGSNYPQHKYEAAGTYYVSVEGKMTHLNSETLASSFKDLLVEVCRWGQTDLNSMKKAFFGYYNLTNIPTDNAGSFSKVTSFEDAFGNCTSLKAIPAGLLDYCVEVTNFDGCFTSCYALESIPEKLFINCGKAQTMVRTFGQIKNLKQIPGDLFEGCKELTSINNLFDTWQSPPLTSIPGTILPDCPKLVSAEAAFAGFDYLETVGEDLFAGCPALKNFKFIFEYAGFKTVPAGLFRKNTKAESFLGAFVNTKIETVPEGLFEYNTEVTTFASLFKDTPLKNVPVGIFDNCRKVEEFYYTFRNCSNLTGESPYTVVGGTKVHLYERENYPGEFTALTDFEKCFTGCDALDDYDDIPGTWGGGKTTP